MVEYARKTYGCSEIDFKVLDIENSNDCSLYLHTFNKIFSFFCFHWIHNKVDALLNTHLMLKSCGEILFDFFLVNPLVELHKSMDAEWQKYIKVSIYIYFLNLYLEAIYYCCNIICVLMTVFYEIKIFKLIMNFFKL